MKVKLTTNVEYDLKIEAESYGVNWADVIDTNVRMWLAIKKKDVSGINLELAKRELEREQQGLMKHQTKIMELKSAIDKCETEVSQKQEKQLIEEKTKIEKLKVCRSCGNIIEGKSQKTNNEQMVCLSCYHDIPLWPMEKRVEYGF